MSCLPFSQAQLTHTPRTPVCETNLALVRPPMTFEMASHKSRAYILLFAIHPKKRLERSHGASRELYLCVYDDIEINSHVLALLLLLLLSRIKQPKKIVYKKDMSIIF